MKKIIVLNRQEEITRSCCNSFKRVEEFNKKLSKKEFIEKNISEKFNVLGEQSYKIETDKVFGHNLYVENVEDLGGLHGVYSFTKTDKKTQYQVYLGPLIKLDPKKLGCKVGLPGCNVKLPGCKNVKGLGCSSKGGDNSQKLNFLNNEKNESDVQALNKHFKLRNIFNRETDDYIFESLESISLSNLIKENKEIIQEKFSEDIDRIVDSHLGFEKMIDIPSFKEMYSQGLLFSSNSDSKINQLHGENKGNKTYLSRFDLWYFPEVKGLLAIIRDLLASIPVIGFLFKKNKEIIIGSNILTKENIEKLELIYSDDYNLQESRTEEERERLKKFKEDFITKVPVTFALKRKMSWLAKLLYGQEYSYKTVYTNGMK